MAHIAFVIAIARVDAVPDLTCVSSRYTVHFHGSGPTSWTTVYCFPRYSIWNQYAGTQKVRRISFALMRNYRSARTRLAQSGLKLGLNVRRQGSAGVRTICL